MKLLKIGRDVNCNIVLHSEKVSSLHAELTLLNNGDITIEDKGSRNGTFVMNQPIKPGKPVSVRRGDHIRFADVELQWSQVPMPEDNSAYQGVYGIGSHFNNDFQISGSTVSRYHATVKHGRDGKFYIFDHSKNGTTVDGIKITPNTPCRIKKSSSVVCGGVPVDLSSLPWPTEIWKYITGVAASIVLVAGIAFGVLRLIDSGPSLQALQNATVCIYEEYYIEVTIKDDPFVGKIKGWPEKWCFFENEDGKLMPGEKGKVEPFVKLGTAFFISEHGELGTNRHMVCPWEYLTNEEKSEINQRMQKMIRIVKGASSDDENRGELDTEYARQLNRILINQIYSGNLKYDDAMAYLERLTKSEFIISGSIYETGIILSGTQVNTKRDMLPWQPIKVSEDPRKDVALLRLNSKKTPQEIIDDGFFEVEDARTDERSLKPQEDECSIIGYPFEYGTGNQIISGGTEFLPIVHRTYVSKTPDDIQFQLQSNVVGGQSGSPIIDKDRRLIGVVWGSIRGTDVAYGCNIKHLKELYDNYKVSK